MKMSWQDVVVDEVDLVTLARVQHVCVSWATLFFSRIPPNPDMYGHAALTRYNWEV